MILPDVNVLVYAHRRDTDRHAEYRHWLDTALSGEAAYGMSDLVVSGFVRIVTHPHVFKQPSSLDDALAFASQVREQPHRVSIDPGPRHWAIFDRLCREATARENLVPDAYLAAIAIESGCEWITTDRDFSRFTALKWRHPLEEPRPAP